MQRGTNGVFWTMYKLDLKTWKKIQKKGERDFH